MARGLAQGTLLRARVKEQQERLQMGKDKGRE